MGKDQLFITFPQNPTSKGLNCCFNTSHTNLIFHRRLKAFFPLLDEFAELWHAHTLHSSGFLFGWYSKGASESFHKANCTQLNNLQCLVLVCWSTGISVHLLSPRVTLNKPGILVICICKTILMSRTTTWHAALVYCVFSHTCSNNTNSRGAELVCTAGHDEGFSSIPCTVNVL